MATFSMHGLLIIALLTYVTAQCNSGVFIVPGNQCGQQSGNGACCPTGNCCSTYGWCGTTSDFCGSGCQPGYGVCSTTTATTSPPVTTSASVTTTTAAPTTTQQQTSGSCTGTPTTNGQCGSQNQLNGFGSCCPSDYPCCSASNWCGVTSAHCGTGCQSAYGTCSTTGTGGTTAAPTTTQTASNTPSASWQSGVASCYGDYQSVLSGSSTSKVSSGLTNQAQPEDWTYATAMVSPGSQFPNQCYAVRCVSGNSGGSACASPAQTIMVKVVDTLNDAHTFDISTAAFGTLGGDGASCSGLLNIQYYPISCNTPVGPTVNQIVSGNIWAVITPNECDSWLPEFVFTNLGGSLARVQATPDPSLAPVDLQKKNGEYAAWLASSYAGKWNPTSGGVQITFTLWPCALSGLPGSCTASSTSITATLAAGWCTGSSGICPPAAIELSTNFPVLAADTNGVSSSSVGIGIWVGLGLSFLWALM